MNDLNGALILLCTVALIAAAWRDWSTWQREDDAVDLTTLDRDLTDAERSLSVVLDIQRQLLAEASKTDAPDAS